MNKKIFNKMRVLGLVGSGATDNSHPTVVITSSEISPTMANPIPVTITFSEEVINFVAGDIVVTGGSVGNFNTLDNIIFTVDIEYTENGLITIDVSAGVCFDIKGNENEAAVGLAVMGGGASDVVAPTVEITSTEASPSFAATIPLTITFSEDVTGFIVGDITVVGCTLGALGGSGAVYTVTATPTGNAITVDIAAGVCVDGAGNANEAATQFVIVSASYGLKLDINASNIAGSDGDALSSVTSSEGLAYVFSQATGTKQPKLKKAANGINGLNTMLFDGGDLLVYGAGDISNDAQGVMFSVFRMSASPSDGQALLTSAKDTASNTYHVLEALRTSATNPNLSVLQCTENVPDIMAGNTTVEATVAHVSAHISSGTAYRLRLDAVEQSITAISGTNNGDWFSDATNHNNFVIGGLKRSGPTEGDFMKGDIARVLLYNLNPSAGFIATMEAYLAALYGITINP
jgi:hypothetical protein